jgi:hypothetical protein
MDDLVANWIDATVAQINGKDLNKKQNDSIIELLEICTNNPSRAFKIICQILATNPNKKVLGCLGAGPLEDLLIQHCDYIDKSIEEVVNTKLLRDCLEHVNMDPEDCPNAQNLYDFLEGRGFKS